MVTIASDTPPVFCSTKCQTQPKSNLVMKPIIPFALLGALFAVGAASAATTDPVGYVSLGDTVALNAVPANSDSRISIPLLKATAFAGTVAPAGVTGNVVTVTGAAFTPSQYVGHYLQVTSGPNEGQIALVTANDATTLTVQPQSDDSITGLAAGHSISLSPAWTLDTFLGPQPVGTQLLAFSGAAGGINIAPDITYEYGTAFGTFPTDRWFNATFFTEAGTDILYPGEGFVLRTGATAIADIVVTGQVSTAKSRNIILGGAGQQDTALSYISPVDEVVVNANIPAATDDQILLFDPTSTGQNKAPTTTYQYGTAFGTFPSNVWYNATFFTALTTEALPAGQSFVYRTAAAAADVVWSDEQVYYSSL